MTLPSPLLFASLIRYSPFTFTHMAVHHHLLHHLHYHHLHLLLLVQSFVLNSRLVGSKSIVERIWNHCTFISFHFTSREIVPCHCHCHKVQTVTNSVMSHSRYDQLLTRKCRRCNVSAASVQRLPRVKTRCSAIAERPAAGCVIVFAKSRTLELGDNHLRTL